MDSVTIGSICESIRTKCWNPISNLTAVERRMRPRTSHNPQQDPRRRVYIKSQPCSALPNLAVGAQLALSARAGAQLRRTRRPMGRVDYGALGERGMYIRIASSATSNSDNTDQ